MNKAVIMAGGFGTRLRPLTMRIPKPMVPLMNAPMMEHIVHLLKRYDINNILSVLYFHPDIITGYFEDGSKFDANMKYVLANADYGTAGAIKNAQEHLTERFIVISGDVLTDFDLNKAIEFHKKKKAMATILLTRVQKPLQYGIVMTDDDGKISRFLEKPTWGQVFSDTINTGIYILEPEVLDLIPPQEEYDFSKDLFPDMLRLKLPLFGYIAEGYWRDIGNLDEYLYGQFDAVQGKVKLMKQINNNGEYIKGINCKISPSAKFAGKVIIGDNTVIGEHSQITDSVIGSNVTIGNGCKLNRVTIWDKTTIGDFVLANEDVICSDCNIGNSVTIAESVFISEGCSIGSQATLLSNIKLWPFKHVQQGATLSRSLVQEEKWLKELFTDARISGLSNIEINPEFGAKLGAAIGMTLGVNTTVLASRDPDKVSRIMKRAISSALSSVGVHVHDLQITSIPQTRQELRIGKNMAGFHVRRSPRQPENTDIIIFNKEGRDIALSKTKAIERYFFGEDIKRVHHEKVGSLRYPERTNEIYISRFLDLLDVESIKMQNFKLLMDYSYGLASTIFPFLLGKLNVDALSLHDYVDATRYNPDAAIETFGVDEVEKIMRSLGYELGIRMEPGAEKIQLIDERGVWYPHMRLLSVVTKLFLETNKHREPYKIAVSIVASDEIDLIAKDYDVEVIRIKNSHSAMMEATRDEAVLFVGGIWGGYIFSDFLFASDGMYSVGKILEMLSVTKYRISQLDELLPRRYQHTEEVDCPWESKGTVMRRAMEYTEDKERLLVDGIKIINKDSTVLLMPHKEKAKFQIVAETDNYEDSVALANTYSVLVNKWRDEE